MILFGVVIWMVPFKVSILWLKYLTQIETLLISEKPNHSLENNLVNEWNGKSKSKEMTKSYPTTDSQKVIDLSYSFIKDVEKKVSKPFTTFLLDNNLTDEDSILDLQKALDSFKLERKVSLSFSIIDLTEILRIIL